MDAAKAFVVGAPGAPTVTAPHNAPTRAGRYFAAPAFFGRRLITRDAASRETADPGPFRWHTHNETHTLAATHLRFASWPGDLAAILRYAGESRQAVSVLVHEALLEETTRFRQP